MLFFNNALLMKPTGTCFIIFTHYSIAIILVQLASNGISFHPVKRLISGGPLISSTFLRQRMIKNYRAQKQVQLLQWQSNYWDQFIIALLFKPSRLLGRWIHSSFFFTLWPGNNLQLFLWCYFPEPVVIECPVLKKMYTFSAEKKTVSLTHLVSLTSC